MIKRLALLLSLALVLALIVPTAVFAGEMTDVGTPRSQTLIVEPDGGVYACPGQFNPYMTGTQASWGMHQLMWEDGLWDVNTMTGERINGLAADAAVPNDDYTEWTITIRQGITWSDGEPVTAKDVAFTFNTIMTNEKLTDNKYYNSLFSGYELIDDYTIKIKCNKPFTRIMTTLGVNMWGCGFRTLPEHIFKDVDILTYPFTEAIFSGAYKVKDFDKLGTWILYEKRDDWQNSVAGVVAGEPKPQYILYRVFGSAESRAMAMINNQVDIMNEVPLEDLKVMLEQNPKVHGWYTDFPYANTDDACSKGAYFNCGKEPFNKAEVRYALTMACDWIEVSENIFDGIGRMSALTIPAITAQVNNYYAPMNDWLTNEFAYPDGYKPWDPDFAIKLRDALIEDFGYESLVGMSDEDTITMFGTGYWKTDKDEATSLLLGTGDFELKDGKWFYKGEPWKIEVIVHPEADSTQAARSSKAIADQWQKFGIQVEVVTLAGADVGNRVNMGDFDVSDSWPYCSNYSMDYYNNISGWNADVYSFAIGELATGVSAFRLPQSDPELAAEIAAIVQKIEKMSPSDPDIQASFTEYLKLTTKASIGIGVQAGTKIVPVNETYWTGYPTANDPFEGPWWWWSLFRYMVPHFQPAA